MWVVRDHSAAGVLRMACPSSLAGGSGGGSGSGSGGGRRPHGRVAQKRLTVLREGLDVQEAVALGGVLAADAQLQQVQAGHVKGLEKHRREHTQDLRARCRKERPCAHVGRAKATKGLVQGASELQPDVGL